MTENVSNLIYIFPGDNINQMVNKTHKTNDIKIGHGLKSVKNIENNKTFYDIVATHYGILQFKAPNTYYIDENHHTLKTYCGHNYSTRYISPCLGDHVIGIVEDKTADYYRININSTNTVYCSRLGFEGATKRNKPELKRGSVLYGRICSVDNERQMDTEMTCISNNGVKKEWSSGETIYGELLDGHLIKVSLGLIRYMLKPECNLLNVLGKYLAYEVVLGLNGYIWMKTGSSNSSNSNSANNNEHSRSLIVNTILLNNIFNNANLLYAKHNRDMKQFDVTMKALVEKLIASSQQMK